MLRNTPEINPDPELVLLVLDIELLTGRMRELLLNQFIKEVPPSRVSGRPFSGHSQHKVI